MYVCAPFQNSPREYKFKIVKCILMYLNKTSNHGLRYTKGCECSLVSFSYADFAGCKSDRKSISDTFHLFGNGLVS